MRTSCLQRVLACARRLILAREGNASIELALITPLLLALAAGATDYGMQLYTSISLEGAARAGMQMLAFDSSDTAGAESAALAATTVDASKVTVSVAKSCQCPDGTSASCSGTCADGSDIEISYVVQVSTNYSRLFPYAGAIDPVPLTGRAEVRVR